MRRSRSVKTVISSRVVVFLGARSLFRQKFTTAAAGKGLGGHVKQSSCGPIIYTASLNKFYHLEGGEMIQGVACYCFALMFVSTLPSLFRSQFLQYHTTNNRQNPYLVVTEGKGS